VTPLITVADSARELSLGKLIAVELDHSDDDDDNGERRSYVVGDPGTAGFVITTAQQSLNVQGAWKQPEGADTDPYGICIHEDGTVYVANAGSNLLQAVRNGRTRTVAFFPATSKIGMTSTPAFVAGTGYDHSIKLAPDPNANYNGDSTPSACAFGPDGFIYVVTLEFVQSIFSPASHIYRINPRASNYEVSAADVWASGFHALTDIHYSRHYDSFFVVERFTAGPASHGDIVRVEIKRAHDHDAPVAGTQTHLGVGILTNPNGVTTDDHGRLFVTDQATDATPSVDGKGRILRIRY